MKGMLILIICFGVLTVDTSAKSPNGVYAGTVHPGLIAQFDFRKNGTVILTFTTVNAYGSEESFGTRRLLYWRSTWLKGEIYLRWKEDDNEEYLNFVFEDDDLISKGRIGGLPVDIRYSKRKS